MNLGYWTARCPRCNTPAPSVPDPDAHISWFYDHACPARAAA
jgi:hypothetical protein